MKNIGIIISSLKTGGGAEHMASKIANLLAKDSYNMHILTFYDSKEKYQFSGTEETLNESFNEFQLKKMIKRIWYIHKFCKKHHINTVIGFKTEANVPLVLTKTLGNTAKIIVSERSDPSQKSFLHKKAIRLLYSFANHVVACSKKMTLTLKNLFQLKNVITIYNIFDTTKTYSHNIPSKYKHIFDEDFVFINIGRLAQQKGQVFLMHAFRNVLEVYPNSKLVILGKPSKEKTVSKIYSFIHRHNLQKNIFILGNQENIYPFLGRSNCFVLSSLWEGFPNVLTEALSLNIPIIATDCETGPREIIAPELSITQRIDYPYMGTYGVLVGTNMDTSNDLTTAMLQMITDPDLQNKYGNGEERLLEFYPDKIINQWKRII